MNKETFIATIGVLILLVSPFFFIMVELVFGIIHKPLFFFLATMYLFSILLLILFIHSNYKNSNKKVN